MEYRLTLSILVRSGIILISGLFVLLFSGCSFGKKSPEVHFATWGHYFSPELQKDFEAQTGIKIRISHFSSNEELLAKMQAGASGYDLAVPSDYMVEILIRLNLLEKLQKDLLPNVTQISPLFLGQDYDPTNSHSLPYAWSVTGLVTHKELRSEPVQSWKDLLELPELRGKVSLLDDARETLGMALKALGHSYNSKDSGELQKARDWLIKNRRQIKMFRSEMVDPLIRKEVVAAQAYSTDARQAEHKSGGKITFKLPKEGTTFAIDNFVIAKRSKNLAEAHRLIDFILEPKNYAKLISHIHAGAVVARAAAHLPAEKATNKLFFPDAETLAGFERLRELGPAQQEFERAWGQVKAAR